MKKKKKLPVEETVQGRLFGCTACERKGEIRYVDWRGEVIIMKCPICKGSGEYSYKGKINIPRKKDGNES